jgi:GT2 family glycosyltransferase
MPDTLARVLDALERQDALPASFEVIVVADAAETDPGAVEGAISDREYSVRRLEGLIPGASSNRNQGWKAARGQLVLFIDDDTIPDTRLISEHLAWHAENPQAEVGVLGHVRWARELRVTPFMRWLERGIQFDYAHIPGTDAGWGRFYTANVSLKRSFIERVGGFDEQRFPYGCEDTDFAYRASKLGFRLLYDRRAEVEHVHAMTLSYWRRRIRRTAVSERRLVTVHPELQPYFRDMFDRAAALPPASGRGILLDRVVPSWVPWLGPRVRRSVDVAYRQALAPEFLDAWESAEADSQTQAVRPDITERTERPR